MERVHRGRIAQRGPHTEHKLCVLYVDDDIANQKVAKLHLEHKLDLLLASTDIEACAVLGREGHRIDAVLMDIELQGSTLDGLALTRLIRGRWDPGEPLPPYAKPPARTDIPVFFVTAYGESYSKETLAATGASALVMKPVNFTRLTMALVETRLDRVFGQFKRIA